MKVYYNPMLMPNEDDAELLMCYVPDKLQPKLREELDAVSLEIA